MNKKKIVEIRVRNFGDNKHWEEKGPICIDLNEIIGYPNSLIKEPMKLGLFDFDDLANAISTGIISASNDIREIRWNWKGSLQGHYI